MKKIIRTTKTPTAAFGLYTQVEKDENLVFTSEQNC
jgi:hypothetical protein